MEVNKLSRREVQWLHEHLAREVLDNYEFLWVLDGCQNNAASAVWAVGEYPWAAGFLVSHRQCTWLKIHNERFLEPLLAKLPEDPLLKFYVTDRSSLDMLMRWFPGGMFSESALYVRRTTRGWRKRFDLELVAEEDGFMGRILHLGNKLGPVVSITTQAVVKPYVEISGWNIHVGENPWFWLEQAVGLTTSLFLSKGKPLVARVNQDTVRDSLGVLGYRDFSPLFYYVSAREH